MPASWESIITCRRFKMCDNSEESVEAESQLLGRPNDERRPFEVVVLAPETEEAADEAFEDTDIIISSFNFFFFLTQYTNILNYSVTYYNRVVLFVLLNKQVQLDFIVVVFLFNTPFLQDIFILSVYTVLKLSG